MVSQTIDEKAVFNVACGIESAELRAAYLRQVCGDDQELLERVELLLRAHQNDPHFLDPPAQRGRDHRLSHHRRTPRHPDRPV